MEMTAEVGMHFEVADERESELDLAAGPPRGSGDSDCVVQRRSAQSEVEE